MRKHHFQAELIDNPPCIFNIKDADIRYWPQFIEPSRAWDLYECLLNETQWQQDEIRLYGKRHNLPRLTSWVGDAGLDYSYSNIKMQPVAWSNRLRELNRQVAQVSQHRFNSVLLNYYRDGQDSNGWHADDEPELGQNPVIASLSLGAARDFDCRHKSDSKLRQRISLAHGSLLIMRGAMQHHWQHCIPKRAHAEPRINLTFRTIL